MFLTILVVDKDKKRERQFCRHSWSTLKRIIISNNAIISNKHGIYKMPQELLGNFGLRILANLKILAGNIRKISKFYGIIPTLPPKIQIF